MSDNNIGDDQTTVTGLSDTYNILTLLLTGNPAASDLAPVRVMLQKLCDIQFTNLTVTKCSCNGSDAMLQSAMDNGICQEVGLATSCIW